MLLRTFILTLSVFFLSLSSYALAPEDKTAIEKGIARYTEAWNQREMKSFSEAYTNDASFINVLGEVYIGRSAIESRHLKMHERKNSKLEIKKIELRDVRPDVVIAVIQWRVVNSGMPAPLDSTSDTRDGIITQVFLKEGSQWLITASHNTFNSSANR